MRITITYCDECSKNNGEDDETPVGQYLMQPKMGEEGYLIDQEYVDLCKECLTLYRKKYPNRDFFYLPHHGMRIQI